MLKASVKPAVKAVFVTGVFVVVGVLTYIATAEKRKGPTWAERDAKVAALKGEMEELSKQIKGTLGDGGCRTDGDCRVIGIGAESCGLPPNYIVYSVHGTKEASLKEFVGKFNEKSAELNNLLLTVPPCGTRLLPIRCIRDKSRNDNAPGQCRPVPKK